MKTIALENNIQKSFLTMGIVLIVVGLGLHNPLSGYSIPSEMSASTRCSDGEKAAYRRQLEELKRSGIKFTDDPTRDSAYIEKSVAECVNFPSEVYGPLGEWRSTSPSIWWFGSVLNLLTYLLSVTAICASGIFTFRQRNDENRK